MNKALNTRVRSEQVLTDADDTWNEVQSGYEENERIYGVNEHDDELLAMFETGEQLDAEMGADGAKQEEKKPAADTSETGSTEDM